MELATFRVSGRKYRMCIHRAIRTPCSIPPGTEVPNEACRQKPNSRAHRGVGVFSTSLLLMITPLRLSAAPFVSSTEELLLCGDHVETSSSQKPRDDCIFVWMEELQKEYQDRDTTSLWKDAHLGPQALSEQELRFLYLPEERHPWPGY